MRTLLSARGRAALRAAAQRCAARNSSTPRSPPPRPPQIMSHMMSCTPAETRTEAFADTKEAFATDKDIKH